MALLKECGKAFAVAAASAIGYKAASDIYDYVFTDDDRDEEDE